MTMKDETLTKALQKWIDIGGLQRWGVPTEILLTERDGRSLAWPKNADEEVCDIFDIDSGQILDEDELASCVAIELPWRLVRLTPVVVLPTIPDGEAAVH